MEYNHFSRDPKTGKFIEYRPNGSVVRDVEYEEVSDVPEEKDNRNPHIVYAYLMGFGIIMLFLLWSMWKEDCNCVRQGEEVTVSSDNAVNLEHYYEGFVNSGKMPK